MAYSGFLLKIGDYVFPNKYIKAGSYRAYENTQNKDPWTDEDGFIHLNALEAKPIKVELDTKAMMTEADLLELMQNIRANSISVKDKSCLLTAYIFEIGEYITQKAYYTDLKPNLYMIRHNTLLYDPIHIEFVGGVADD